jgi:hypothetical protein
VVEEIRIGYTKLRADRTEAKVSAPKHEPLYSCGDQRARAHRARLQCYVERRATQAVVRNDVPRLSQDQYFRMRRWIVQRYRAIVSPGDDFVITHQDGPNGHLPCRFPGKG